MVLFENEQIVLKESGHHSLKVKNNKLIQIFGIQESYNINI